MTAPTTSPAETSISTTHHRELPATTPLFRDFLDSPEKLVRFFPSLSDHSPNLSDLIALAPEIAARHGDRSMLVEVLRGQNAAWGAEEAALVRLETLLNPTAVAVVGGQQAGLFGGPSLCIHKALTLIRLADEATEAGIPTVPVFWIASDDHDFEEINHTSMLTPDGTIREIRYAGDYGTRPPVGNLALGMEIDQAVAELAETLPKTEFTEGVLETVRAAYLPGASWTDAFGRLMARMFSRFGLVLVDPRDARLRRLAKPAFDAAINRASELVAAIHKRSLELNDAGYHAQVYTDSNLSLVFLETERGRASLVQTEDGFRLRNPEDAGSGPATYAASELAALFDADPVRVSPNALLRPIVQDMIFPNVAHVVGAAELAYLAQSQPIYDFLDRPAPLRWVRSSASIVERRHVKSLSKFNLSVSDVVQGEKALMNRVVTEFLDNDTVRVFEETEAAFNLHLDRLQQVLERQDPSLAKALAQGREKILHNVTYLHNRFLANRSQAEDATRRQIERAVTALHPNGKLQERDINFLSFAAKYGLGLIDRLKEEMNLDPSHHQWITV